MTNKNKKRRMFWFKVTDNLLYGDKVSALLTNRNGLGYKAWLLFCGLTLQGANTDGRIVYNAQDDKEKKLTIPQMTLRAPGLTEKETKTCLKMLVDLDLLTKVNGVYVINEFSELVGSITAGAQEKARARASKKAREKALEYMDGTSPENSYQAEQGAHTLTGYLYKINFVNRETDFKLADRIHNELTALILKYGIMAVDKALKYVIQATTERDDDGLVVRYRFGNYGGDASEIDYLVASLYNQCEKDWKQAKANKTKYGKR